MLRGECTSNEAPPRGWEKLCDMKKRMKADQLGISETRACNFSSAIYAYNPKKTKARFVFMQPQGMLASVFYATQKQKVQTTSSNEVST
jgi:hypothetical protein